MTKRRIPHLSIRCHQDVSAICAPLFQKYSLSHLNFIRVYSDGTAAYLCNNWEWLDYYLSQNYPTIGAFEQQSDLSQFQHVLWNALSDDPIFQFTRERFAIFHGLTLIKKEKAHTSFYNLGTRQRNPSILNHLINQLKTLHQFAAEFNQKAHKLIRLAHSQRIQVRSKNLLVPTRSSSFENSSSSAMTIKQPDQLSAIKLTPSETLCIRLYLHNNKPKEIATLLGISDRTVEKHLENIKRKFNCKHLLQLGFVLAKAGFEL